MNATIILGAAALVMVGAASYAYFPAATIERWFEGMLGPPRVEMKDGHDENASGPFDHSVLAKFAKAGVGIDALAARLQDEGDASFVKSWNELIEVIASKTAALTSCSRWQVRRITAQTHGLLDRKREAAS